MVDLPVIGLTRAGACLHGGITHDVDLTHGVGLIGKGFAVGMEHGIISAEAGRAIGMRRCLDRGLIPDSPPVVFIPIGVIGAADIGDGSLVRGADQRFTEAGTAGVVKLIGDTAVSYGDVGLVRIGQGGDVGDGEGGVCPARFASVRRVVYIASAFGRIGDYRGIGGLRGGIEVSV